MKKFIQVLGVLGFCLLAISCSKKGAKTAATFDPLAALTPNNFPTNFPTLNTPAVTIDNVDFSNLGNTPVAVFDPALDPNASTSTPQPSDGNTPQVGSANGTGAAAAYKYLQNVFFVVGNGTSGPATAPPPGGLTVGLLTSINSGCNSSTIQSKLAVCHSAAQVLCLSYGYLSGFLIEASGTASSSAVAVACVGKPQLAMNYYNVPEGVLSSFITSCPSGTGIAFVDNILPCFAAGHRLGRALSLGTTVPQQYANNKFSITAYLKRSVTMLPQTATLNIGVLTAILPSCTASTYAQIPCAAAAHRYCNQMLTTINGALNTSGNGVIDTQGGGTGIIQEFDGSTGNLMLACFNERVRI